MVDVKLLINGQEFPLHYKMLSNIARFLPDNKQYTPLVKALLGLNIPSITQDLIGNDALTVEDLDAIWDKENLAMRRLLIDDDFFIKNLSDSQVEQIIDINDSEILKSIARNAEQLYPMRGEKQAMRLSGTMADKLMEFISNHSDIGVRRELAENSQAPAKFKPSLAEMVKKGLNINHLDVESLNQEDFEILKNSSPEVLKLLANSVEDIEDKKLCAEVIDFLCSYPDPEIRLELAENSWAPKSALQRLAEDPDADVADAAQESLS